MRAEFAKLCLETVKIDSESVVMIGDISHFLLREVEQVAPDRFYNIGICEQSMVGMASGMAIEGMRPIIHTIAPFLVEFQLALLINDFRRPGFGHKVEIGRSCCSNIQESNVMCVVLDKSFSAFDVFSHQDTENVVGY